MLENPFDSESLQEFCDFQAQLSEKLDAIDFEYSHLLYLAQEWAEAVFMLSLGESYGKIRAEACPPSELALLWGLDKWLACQKEAAYNTLCIETYSLEVLCRDEKKSLDISEMCSVMICPSEKSQ